MKYLKKYNEDFHQKMKGIVDDTLKVAPGGIEFFDKLDATLKMPKNLDIVKYIFDSIHLDNKSNFNLILTGKFGDWILSLIKKGTLKVPGNVVLTNGELRNRYIDGKIFKGKDVNIIHTKNDLSNQKFILFDDSYYEGSTKNAIRDYLKKYNSDIVKTYVLYDGSYLKDPNRKNLYRYYDYHKGTKLPVDLLIDYLYSLDIEVPKDIIRDKIVKNQIHTINEIISEINKFLINTNREPLKKLMYSDEKQILKKFENFNQEIETIIETEIKINSNHILFENDDISGLNTFWTVGDITITLSDVIDYLDNENVEIKYINPKSIEKLLIKTKRDKNRIKEANLKYPLIITMQNGKFLNIIDGQHRLVKCLQNNIEKIKIRILDLDNAPEIFNIVFGKN